MVERLAADVIAGEEAGDHARIGFRAAIEQGQRAVGVAEETQHRRHAIMSVAQAMRRLFIHRTQRFHHHNDVPIGRQQRFG
jgi:hypothetical protein